MKIKNVMELKVLSLSENESFARSVVGAFATQLDPTLEEVADIKTAVSEAVTNCIVHAYPDCVGDIRITAEISEGRITVRIQDYGVGIADVAQARQPFYSTSKDESRSGMGFTVMETFMDELNVESEPGRGTTVTMTKTFKKQG